MNAIRTILRIFVAGFVGLLVFYLVSHLSNFLYSLHVISASLDKEIVESMLAVYGIYGTTAILAFAFLRLLDFKKESSLYRDLLLFPGVVVSFVIWLVVIYSILNTVFVHEERGGIPIPPEIFPHYEDF